MTAVKNGDDPAGASDIVDHPTGAAPRRRPARTWPGDPSGAGRRPARPPRKPRRWPAGRDLAPDPRLVGGAAGWVRAAVPCSSASPRWPSLLVTSASGVGLGVRADRAGDTVADPRRRTARARHRRATWTTATETIVMGPAPATRPDRDGRRGRAGRRGRHVPGTAAQSARRSVRARARRRAPRSVPRSRSSSRSSSWSSQFGLLHGLAFAGALLCRLRSSSGSVAAGGPAALTRLLLTGYAVGSLLAALPGDGDVRVRARDLRQIFSFLLGGLVASSWVAPGGRGAARSSAALRRSSCSARARSTACCSARRPPRHLGIDVRRERGILLALASLATAAAVAISGLIGFVGLVVPHVVRLVVGPAARRVLPISAIGGRRAAGRRGPRRPARSATSRSGS